MQVDPVILDKTVERNYADFWQQWTQTETLLRWLGPPQAQMSVISGSIGPNGTLVFKQSFSNQHQCGKIEFLKLEQSTVEYVQSITNEHGDTIGHPQVPAFPKRMLTQLQFEPVDNKTRVKMIWQPMDPNPDEAEFFFNYKQIMQDGLQQVMDRL
ncbi:hypothetical protein EDD86DRAFT_245274 [Gorgonomyces haynaldii]|nr:hypothetical protein EDD86DRAFT_245274 [Gorgonomyces haynaldii]